MSSEMVRVKNKGEKTYEETYQDKLISIPSGGHILMRKRDAIRFLGTQSASDGNGSWVEKNLVIVEVPEETVEKITEIVCNFCGMKFKTEAELKEHSEMHKDNLITDRKKK